MILVEQYRRSAPTAWGRLFEPLSFFTMHTFYVMVGAAARTHAV